jgi:truncated hemoglobin YjbI
MRDLIYSVVEAFYDKATKDILIGYHFDKFSEPEVLIPHLERITSFWDAINRINIGSTGGIISSALYSSSIKN